MKYFVCLSALFMPYYNTAPIVKEKPLHQRLQSFGGWNENAMHTLRLCADLPVNEAPQKVHYKDEPGHVYLILSKKFMNDSIHSKHLVFGFHPRTASSAIAFAYVTSEIRDNGKREYEAYAEKYLNKDQYEKVVEAALAYSKRKYHLNHYNCYDYALDVYNSICIKDTIPKRKVKFPFIYGRGGSPCGLYKDFSILLKRDSAYWSSVIHFGAFKAPESW